MRAQGLAIRGVAGVRGVEVVVHPAGRFGRDALHHPEDINEGGMK
jgi:hypothetical protein